MQVEGLERAVVSFVNKAGSAVPSRSARASSFRPSRFAGSGCCHGVERVALRPSHMDPGVCPGLRRPSLPRQGRAWLRVNVVSGRGGSSNPFAVFRGDDTFSLLYRVDVVRFVSRPPGVGRTARP